MNEQALHIDQSIFNESVKRTNHMFYSIYVGYMNKKNHAAARKPRDAEAILFGSKFAKDKARLQSSKYIGTLYSRSMLCLVQPRCTGFHVTSCGRRP